jgi:hypothetical protein
VGKLHVDSEQFPRNAGMVRILAADNRRVNQLEIRRAYFATRPSPIVLRSCSGYFRRACSACSLLSNGFESAVIFPSTYLKSTHCTVVLAMVKSLAIKRGF